MRSNDIKIPAWSLAPCKLTHGGFTASYVLNWHHQRADPRQEHDLIARADRLLRFSSELVADIPVVNLNHSTCGKASLVPRQAF